MKPRHVKRTPGRTGKRPGIDRPGAIFIVIALAALGMVSARFLGYDPQQLIAVMEPGPPVAPSLDVSTRGEGSTVTPVATPLPRVLIYHTHGSENYSPNATHARAGSAGDVVTVGETLAAALEERGIKTIHLADVYDNPWNTAYAASAQAVSQVLAANPQIEMVLDVHRDAVESQQIGVATAAVDGASAAKVLFTVSELNNRNVQANVALATTMKDELDRYFPGLSRGVRMFAQQSNGDLHAQALEVYIGDYYDSTVDEAKRTAVYVADVIATVLNRQ